MALIPSIAIALSVAFTSLSLMHLYWLSGGWLPFLRLMANLCSSRLLWPRSS